MKLSHHYNIAMKCQTWVSIYLIYTQKFIKTTWKFFCLMKFTVSLRSLWFSETCAIQIGVLFVLDGEWNIWSSACVSVLVFLPQLLWSGFPKIHILKHNHHCSRTVGEAFRRWLSLVDTAFVNELKAFYKRLHIVFTLFGSSIFILWGNSNEVSFWKQGLRLSNFQNSEK